MERSWLGHVTSPVMLLHVYGDGSRLGNFFANDYLGAMTAADSGDNDTGAHGAYSRVRERHVFPPSKKSGYRHLI